VATFLHFVSDLLTPREWDALRNWVSALVGLGALMVALRTYRRSVRLRREEQARLVYSKLTAVSFHNVGETFPVLPDGVETGYTAGGANVVPRGDSMSEPAMLAVEPAIRLTIGIHNGSKELVGPVKVQVINTGLDSAIDGVAMILGAVDPESTKQVNFVFANPVHPGQPGLAARVVFRDSSGRWWCRHMSEPIESVHDDPENAAMPKVHRDDSARRALSMGLTPSPEPKVLLGVRWHRFWRARRGKTPIP